MNDLKPCPFCACKEAEEIKSNDPVNTKYVLCWGCGAMAAPSVWNTRHDEPRSVKNELPKPETDVLLFIEGAEVYLHGAMLTGGKFIIPGLNRAFVVTHWLPMPPAPKDTK